MSGRSPGRRRPVPARASPLEPIPSSRAPPDDSNYDLAPISNMSQSLFSSTKNMFKILRPLDSAGPLPSLSASSRKSSDKWPQPDPQVKLEDLPDLAAACRLVDDYNDARNTVRSLSGSDAEEDVASVKEAQALLASKPAISFSCMMALALLDSPSKRLTVSEIYKWIKATFPYFASAEAGSGWKNSVRHNLSLNSHFKRVCRQLSDGEKAATIGKGSYWTLKTMSLPHLEERLQPIVKSSECSGAYLEAIRSAKVVVDSYTQTQPVLSPSKISTDTTRRRRRQSRSKTQQRARDMRELDAIAHTLLSLKSANARGFRSKPLPSIKRSGPPSAHESPMSSDANTRTSSAVIAGRYDPHARLSTAGSTNRDETEIVVMQSPDSTSTAAALHRSRVPSGHSARSGMDSCAAGEEGSRPMFTFTSPMSMGSQSRLQTTGTNGAKRRGDDLLERMDTATDDELSATAALLSLAGVTDTNLFDGASS